MTPKTARSRFTPSARLHTLLSSPKSLSLLAELALYRHELDHGHIIRPTYNDALEQRAVLQTIVGEVLSGWDYRARDAGNIVGEPEFAEEELERVARDLNVSVAAQWWWEPLDRPHQTMITRDVDDMLGRVEDLADQWAAKRAFGLMVSTSTWLSPELPAAQLTDSGFMAHQQWDTKFWRVEVAPTAKIFELRSAADHLDLCERYPLSRPAPPSWREHGVTTSRILLPDWDAVREDWDGVHLSVSGQLAGTGVPIQVGSHTTIWLEADSEKTMWFKNVLTVADELPAPPES